MGRFFIIINMILFISLSAIGLQAQETFVPRDPCWLLTNPPDAPANDSRQASLEHSALQMTDAGENDAALTVFDRILDADDEYASAYALRGCTYERLGDTRKALADWETFVSLTEDDAQAEDVERLMDLYNEDETACSAGSIYDSQQEARETIIEYQSTTADGDDHNQRGLAYLCLGDYELAIRDFARALDSDKTSSTYYNNRGFAYLLLGDTERAISDYTRSIALDDEDPITYNNRADVYIDLEDYDAALDDLNTVLDIDPTNENGLSSRADVYRIVGEYEKAIDDYTTLIDLYENAIYYNGRGLSYTTLEQYDEAADDFEAASDLQPDSALYWYNRGFVYFYMDQVDESLDAFSRSLELNPDDADALEWRAYLYFYLDESGLCIADYTVLFTMDTPLKEQGYNWLRRGVCYHTLGNQEQAIRDYTQALEFDPDYALAYAYRGVAYHEIDRTQAALDDLTRAIELNEEDPFAWQERGLVYDTLQEYDSAVEDYTEALRLNPDRPLTYFNRGYAYYGLKDYRAAKDDFETYLDMEPDSERRQEIEDLIAEMDAINS